MQVYSFEIVLSELLPKSTSLNPEPFETLAERLYEAGCDDCLPVACEGSVTLGFAREAGSLGVAIDSALRDIRKAGFKVTKVICEELPEPATV